MHNLSDIITAFSAAPYGVGDSILRVNNDELRISYLSPQQQLSAAQDALAASNSAVSSPKVLILDERIAENKVGCRYATVHPSTIRESVTLLEKDKNGITPELVQHVQQRLLERIVIGLRDNTTIAQPKLSDYLAYSSDVVFSTAVYLQDAQGRILLQQRSRDETSFPLYWQPSANGKLETYSEALKREIGEELGERIENLNLPVTLISETPYILSKKGVDKPAIGRDYVASIADMDIIPLLKKSDETEQFMFVSKEDLKSGRIISKSFAKAHNLTPATHIILFDDQYASLSQILLQNEQSAENKF